MPQPFTAEDLYLHRRVNSLHCVDGADRAVCSISSIDREGDAQRTYLWQFRLDGSGGAALACSDGSDSSPRWSPHGDRLAFIPARGGTTQVHVAPVDGDSAEQVGSFAGGVMNLRWMPGGEALVVTAAVTVDPELRGQRATRPPPTRRRGAPEVAWRLPYKRDGIGYLLPREIHLFRLDVATGEQRQPHRRRRSTCSASTSRPTAGTSPTPAPAKAATRTAPTCGSATSTAGRTGG